MANDDKTQLYDLLGGLDNLVAALHIDALPLEMQLLIVEHFASVLFKRILLKVQDNEVESVKEALNSGDMDRFTQSISKAIPNAQSYISDEISRTANEFRI